MAVSVINEVLDFNEMSEDISNEFGVEIWYFIQVVENIKYVSEENFFHDSYNVYLSTITNPKYKAKIERLYEKERYSKIHIPLYIHLQTYSGMIGTEVTKGEVDILTYVRNSFAHHHPELYNIDFTFEDIDNLLQYQLENGYDILMKITGLTLNELINP